MSCIVHLDRSIRSEHTLPSGYEFLKFRDISFNEKNKKPLDLKSTPVNHNVEFNNLFFCRSLQCYSPILSCCFTPETPIPKQSYWSFIYCDENDEYAVQSTPHSNLVEIFSLTSKERYSFEIPSQTGDCNSCATMYKKDGRIILSYYKLVPIPPNYEETDHYNDFEIDECELETFYCETDIISQKSTFTKCKNLESFSFKMVWVWGSKIISLSLDTGDGECIYFNPLTNETWSTKNPCKFTQNREYLLLYTIDSPGQITVYCFGRCNFFSKFYIDLYNFQNFEMDDSWALSFDENDKLVLIIFNSKQYNEIIIVEANSYHKP